MKWTAAQALAQEFADHWQSQGGPGGGIVVFDQDSVRVSAFGGCANVEFNQQFTSQTVVRLASVTKHVVASLALILVDEGLLDLNSKLSVYLPQLRNAMGGVTVRGAMDMTGGIPDMIDTAWMLGVPRTALLDRRHVLDFLASIDGLNFAPGDEFSYSNAGYRLVEAAMEARGTPLATGLHDRLFRPLGVTATLPGDYADVVLNLAPGYWCGSTGWRHGISGMPYSGADGLCASPDQFVVWLQALLADRGPAKGLLGRLAHPASLSNGRVTSVGFGLAHSSVAGQDCVGFVGGLPGYRSAFLLVPALKLGILAVANREDADLGAQSAAILSALVESHFDRSARNVALPEGFYLSDGPDWLEIKQGYGTFLGTQSYLYPTEDGRFDSRAFYAPMTLREEEGGVVGDVGHRFRRFHQISPEALPVAKWAGEWRHPEQNSVFRIDVQGQEAWITIGSGPAMGRHALTPLDRRRSIFERAEGPRRQRVCLYFSDDLESVLLATQRSRVLWFQR